MNKTTLIKRIVGIVGVFGLVATLNTSAYAQTTTSANSPEYDFRITSCISQFDWARHIDLINQGLPSASTWNDIGCAADTQLIDNGQVIKTRYNQFEIGDAAKQAFGDLPVLDIFPNEGYAAQNLNTYNTNGSVDQTFAAFDRSQPSNLNTIFNDAELNALYPSGGARTGAPRVFSTGVDQFTPGATPRIYEGGWCEVSNGQIILRTTRAGESFNPEDFGRDRDNVSTSCARSGQDSIEDMPFRIYQFIYEIPYWNNQECQDYAGFTADQYDDCLNFFRNRYGRTLTGNGDTGTRIYAVYTYYGAFSQPVNGVFNWVGWATPSVGGPRATSDDAFVRSYEGFSTYVR